MESFNNDIIQMCKHHELRCWYYGASERLPYTFAREPTMEWHGGCDSVLDSEPDSESDLESYWNLCIDMHPIRLRAAHIHIFWHEAEFDDDQDILHPFKIEFRIGLGIEYIHIFCGLIPRGVTKMEFELWCKQDVDDAMGFVESIIKRIVFHRDRIGAIAARKIQRAFRRAMSDPQYAMCRKRLMREFEEMV